MPHPVLSYSREPLTPERIAYLNQRFEERIAAEQFLKEQKKREKLLRKEEKKYQKSRRTSSVRSGSVSLDEDGLVMYHPQRGSILEDETRRGSTSGGNEIGPWMERNRLNSNDSADGVDASSGGQWNGSKNSDSGLFAAIRRVGKGKEPRIV